MNPEFDLINAPGVQRLGWVLLHFVWQGTLLALVYWLAMLVVPRNRANTRYWAGVVCLVAMLAAPAGTFFATGVTSESQRAIVRPAASPRTVAGSSVPASQNPASLTDLPQGANRGGGIGGFGPHSTIGNVQFVLPWLVVGWLAGVHFLGLRMFLGWMAIQKYRRQSLSGVPEYWHRRLGELARNLMIGKPVQVMQSALVEVPTAIGWLKPAILLPAGCLTNLSTAQIEAVLTHELAHIRRHDYLVNLLQSLVEVILFYHPGVWWVSRQVRHERENCCDDLAIDRCPNRVDYARALLSLEESRRGAAYLAMTTQGGELELRVRRLLGRPKRLGVFSRVSQDRLGLTALLAAILAGGLVSQVALVADGEKEGQRGEGVVPGTEEAAQTKPKELQPAKALPGNRYLVVNLDEGSIEIIPIASGNIQVAALSAAEGGWTEDKALSSEVILTEQDGSTIARMPKGAGGNILYRFKVPDGWQLDLKSNKGGIAIEEFTGDLKVSAAVGDVRLGRIDGKVEAYSSAGHISLISATGHVLVKSSGGSIKLGELKSTAEAESSGGGIWVKQANAGLKAAASGGGIKVFSSRDWVEAEASGGSVYLNLGGQPSRDSRLRAFGGGVYVKADATLNLAVEAEGNVRGNLPIEWTERPSERSRFGRGVLNRREEAPFLRTSASRISLDTLREEGQLMAGEEKWDDAPLGTKETRVVQRAGERREGDAARRDAPREGGEGARRNVRARGINAEIKEYRDGALVLERQGDGGLRTEVVKLHNETEIVRETDQWEQVGENENKMQRKVMKANENWLDRGARVQVFSTRDGVIDRVVILWAPAEKPDEANRIRREGEPDRVIREGDGQPREGEIRRDWGGPRRDGERPAVREGREGVAENRPPDQVQEPPAVPIKYLPPGILLRDGSFVEAEVLLANGSTVKYRNSSGAEQSIVTSAAAAILLKALPENKKELLERPRRGLLLVTGDFFEGDLESCQDQTVGLSSTLFGLRKFDRAEAQAMLLHEAKPGPTQVPSVLKGYSPTGVKPPTAGEEKK